MKNREKHNILKGLARTGTGNYSRFKENDPLVSLSLFFVIVLLNGIVYLVTGKHFIMDHAYIFVLINLLLFFFVAALSPIAALSLLLAVLPFSERIFKVEIGVVTWNPYTLGIVAFSFYLLYSIFISGKRYSWRLHDSFLAVVLLVFFASTMFSENILEAGYLYFHSLVIPFLSYALIKTFLDRESNFVFAKGIFFLSITIFALYTFYIFIKTHSRPYPFGIPPIGAATFITLPLVCWWLTGAFLRPTHLPLFLVNLAGLISTASRVYTLSFLVSPIFKRFARKGLLKLYVSFMFSGLIFTVLLSINPELVKPSKEVVWAKETTLERLTNIDYYKDALYRRAVLYRYGLEVFKEHPILGVGLRKEEKKLGVGYVTQHNFHVEWLEFGGVLGWLLFFLMFAAFFREAERGDEVTKILALVVFIMLLNSFTNGFMHGKMPYVVFITMGFAMARREIVSLKLQKNTGEK